MLVIAGKIDETRVAQKLDLLEVATLPVRMPSPLIVDRRDVETSGYLPIPPGGCRRLDE
jgi:hypothetical protein